MKGAASEVIVPVPIKAHLSTVPEEAFEVINHDVQLGQSFKSFRYGCTSCWGHVGAEIQR